jgi:hypothetical protein
MIAGICFPGRAIGTEKEWNILSAGASGDDFCKALAQLAGNLALITLDWFAAAPASFTRTTQRLVYLLLKSISPDA